MKILSVILGCSKITSVIFFFILSGCFYQPSHINEASAWLLKAYTFNLVLLSYVYDLSA